MRHGRDFRLEFLAKLFFAAQEPPPALSTLLTGQRDACDELIARLRARIAAIAPERPYDRLVLQFRLGQLEATLAWLDTCADTLLTHPAPRVPPPS